MADDSDDNLNGDDEDQLEKGKGKGKKGATADEPGEGADEVFATVGGEPITKREALTRLEKAAGADAKFEQAARMRKESRKQEDKAERYEKMVELMQHVQAHPEDTDALLKLATDFPETGMSREKVETLIEGVKEAQKDQGPQFVGEEDLDPAIQKELKQSREDRRVRQEQGKQQAVKALLDRDQVLGKIMKNKAVADGLRRRLFDFGFGELDRRMAQLGDKPLTREVLAGVVGELRKFAQDLGLVEGTADTDKVLSTPGLGRAPGHGASGLAPQEPLKRASARDVAAYERYAGDRMEQLLAEAKANQQED